MESNEHICRCVIEVLLGIKVERIEYAGKQETLDVDFESRGVRLDVVTKGDGKVFDLEMQTTEERNLPKQAKYYQAIMDLDFLDADCRTGKTTCKIRIHLIEVQEFLEFLATWIAPMTLPHKNKIVIAGRMPQLVIQELQAMHSPPALPATPSKLTNGGKANA